MRLKNKQKKIAVFLIMLVLFTMDYRINAFADIKDDVKSSTDADGTDKFLISDMPEIQGESAIVVDLKTGYTLYEKNITQKLYPASITKIMTATLAIENLLLTDTVTFSHDAVYTIEPGSSSAYMSEGEQITVADCLYGLMLISGNDLANGLAEKVSGSMDGFAAKMTEKAKEIGCINTNFTNSHGLHDENHYTCAYDMAKMAAYAYNNLETFRTLISTYRYTVDPTPYCNETRYWHNTNRFIQEGNDYYDKSCLGGKTGFTDQAQATIVSFHKIHDRVIMVVDMKAPSGQTFSDVEAICNHLRAKDASFFVAMDQLYEALAGEKATDVLEDESSSQDETTKEDVKEDVQNEDEKTSPVFVVLGVIALAIAGLVIFDIYVRIQRSRLKSRRRKERRRIEKQIYNESKKVKKGF